MLLLRHVKQSTEYTSQLLDPSPFELLVAVGLRVLGHIHLDTLRGDSTNTEAEVHQAVTVAVFLSIIIISMLPFL